MKSTVPSVASADRPMFSGVEARLQVQLLRDTRQRRPGIDFLNQSRAFLPGGAPHFLTVRLPVGS